MRKSPLTARSWYGAKCHSFCMRSTSMTRGMRSTILSIALFLLILSSVSAIVVTWKRWHDRNTWTRVTVAQIESEISHHIPSGTSHAEVVSYLDKKKIPHSYYGDAIYSGTDYYNSELALVPKTASSGLVTTDIQIIFRFDSKMKLVSYQVHQVYTGP